MAKKLPLGTQQISEKVRIINGTFSNMTGQTTNIQHTKIYMKLINILKISLLSLIFIPLVNVNADYFTYTPDGSDKLLHVYNTTLNRYVKGAGLVGTPRNVHVSHSGLKVFVSSVVQDSNQSYINVLNAINNTVEANGAIKISGENVRGLVITQDDNTLFVTHEDGITKIERPGIINTSTVLDLSYRGMNLVLSEDEKYLFVIGTDDTGNDGISVVDLSTFTEIADYSLGTGKGASEIVFNNSATDPKLFIALSENDQVVSVKIEGYDSPEALSLDLFKVRDFTLGANPIDIQLNNTNSELFVVLSYIKDQGERGTGNGNVVVLDTADISANNEVSGISEIFFSNEDSSPNFNPDGGRIHPLALNIDENGFIYVLKQIWSDKNGVYVIKLKDTTNISTGERSIKEIQSYNLGNRVSTQANGQFLGPNCDACPDGRINGDLEVVERPASLNAYLLLLLTSLLLLARRFKTTCK